MKKSKNIKICGVCGESFETESAGFCEACVDLVEGHEATATDIKGRHGFTELTPIDLEAYHKLSKLEVSPKGGSLIRERSGNRRLLFFSEEARAVPDSNGDVYSAECIEKMKKQYGENGANNYLYHTHTHDAMAHYVGKTGTPEPKNELTEELQRQVQALKASHETSLQTLRSVLNFLKGWAPKGRGWAGLITELETEVKRLEGKNETK